MMDATTTFASPLFPVAGKAAARSRAGVTTLAIALVLVIGWFDYVTGDFSLTVFYLAPVALATWYAGPGDGWFMGFLSAFACLAGDLATSSASRQELMPYWNAGMLALIYGVVVQVLSALQRLQRQLEARVQQRTAALLQANTELEAARLHFIEADKLESIGRLAAGVAHEVKNPLMTISMIADCLPQVIPPDAPDRRIMLEDLRDAVGRANRVIGEMLEFARPAVLSLQPDDFHLVAERALGLLKHEITRRRLDVVCAWCSPAPMLLLDRNKLQQALLNLLLNAIQASPENGTLNLRSRLDGAGLTVEIDDQGAGISESDQRKLFEPFFTTKPVGQGTGLGLSVARQIIQLHCGTLRLANRPGGGARVTIYLPASNHNQKQQL